MVRNRSNLRQRDITRNQTGVGSKFHNGIIFFIHAGCSASWLRPAKTRHRTLFVWEEKGEAAKFEGDFAHIRIGRHDVIKRLPQESGATAATTAAATGRANSIFKREP